MGIVPAVAVGATVMLNYEKRAVFEKTVESTNYCRALANHIEEVGFLSNPNETSLDDELSLVSEILSGRIMVIDSDYVVVSDTYSLANGKIMISKEVIDCFNSGVNESHNDEENKYI
ncbi:MAG: two-component sensor histidine kinase, partial [Lachnospiraceae bacterium]|nr:two-component sensor histidine kinase [Lachnospiraceae bacterium]